MDMEDGQISLRNNDPFDSLESYFQYLSEMEERSFATNSQILEIEFEHGAKRDSLEKRKERVIEDMAKEISMNSHHLKSLSCQVEKVVDEISSDVKDLSARSRDMAKHLRDLSSEANKILEIKIENGAKRDSVEKRKEKVIKDMAKEISVNSHHLESIACQSGKMLQIKIERQEKRDLLEERNEKMLQIKIERQAKRDLLEERNGKGEDTFLKNCQSLLSDFVFFMLSLIPWLLYYNESDSADNNKKTPPPEYFHLLFFVSALAFLGMFGFALSHIARKSWWVKAVYVITAIAVMATIGLVGYALFHIIPAEHEYHHSTKSIYITVYVIIGLVLLGAWWHNFNSP